ncbi:hypothetical protein BaRGS_00030027 [Batillaria attramentaria]|uniref:Uncharacterized protein n=1 Tax=Batillaria attramentaria TaxID=370345 RepID=A0ABD0JVX4_9CAEN
MPSAKLSDLLYSFPFENSSFGMCERTAYALFPLLNTDATMPFAHLTPRVVWFFDDRINSLRAALSTHHDNCLPFAAQGVLLVSPCMSPDRREMALQIACHVRLLLVFNSRHLATTRFR